jgi:hypothetical protein
MSTLVCFERQLWSDYKAIDISVAKEIDLFAWRKDGMLFERGLFRKRSDYDGKTGAGVSTGWNSGERGSILGRDRRFSVASSESL